MTRSLVGAGVAVSVPAAGGFLAAAPAHAAPTPATPTPSASGAAAPRLAYGATGAAVRVLQARVGVTADGVFGPATLASLKRFQSANGLVADGVVGPLTWAKLGVSAAVPPKTTTKPSTPKPSTSAGTMACAATSTTLRYGSSGQLVKILQSRLGVSADGFFGAQTQKAVTTYQSAHGLVVDGIAGPAVWAQLGCTTAPATTVGTPGKGTSGTPVTTSPVSGAAIIAMAQRFTGTPYVWGASSPAGFDCSGLTSYVFKQFGFYMPRTAAQQQAYFKPVSAPRPGDLIFYGSPAYHVAIYVGNGMMIDSPHPGGYVGLHSIYGKPAGYARVF